jgi:hypothetical protein
MTRIPYASRSSFLAICEQSICRSRADLLAGQPVQILFQKSGGYAGAEIAAIRESATTHFVVDRRYADPTRFPARLRAAATALHRQRCFGRFELCCHDGELTLRLATLSPKRPRVLEPAHSSLCVNESHPVGSESDLILPTRLLSKDEVFGDPCPVPKAPGVYAWYFRGIPDGVMTDGCIRFDSCCLLYVGIAPTEPPRNGREPSRQRLFDRIRYHYAGNAQGSTLRLSLGCLLAEKLGTSLRAVGSGRRLTFGVEAERALSAWMRENAFVAWTVHPRPWTLERELIGRLCLPLNIQGNARHPFQATLRGIRQKAKRTAKADGSPKRASGERIG